MSNEKTESYYKILGTTAKISNARVKEKYIQAVKQHPPETDPDGFEKVRRAYETLKDPVKRKQYDLVRKYGENVEELLEKAFIKSEKGDYQGASDLLAKASKIAPDNQSVLIRLMILSIASENLDEMEKNFEKLVILIVDTDELVDLYSIKARALFENDYGDLALETLEQGKEKCPNKSSFFNGPSAVMYLKMGQLDKASEAINAAIPTPENETFEDIYIFITWATITLEMENWQSMAKVQTRFRKFLKNITDEEEMDIAYDLLYERFDELYEHGSFRFAEFYINVLKVLADNSDSEIKEVLDDTKKLARIQKEIDRLERDEEINPLIFFNTFEWFYEDYLPPEQLSMMLNSIPVEMLDELRDDKEEYAAGIMRLKKKFPLLYNFHKEDWDKLLAKLTEGFNREMRRELGRVK